MECFNKDAYKKEKGKYDAFCTSPGRDSQIATWPNCSTLHTSFILVYIYQCGKVISVGIFTSHIVISKRLTIAVAFSECMRVNSTFLGRNSLPLI